MINAGCYLEYNQMGASIGMPTQREQASRSGGEDSAIVSFLDSDKQWIRRLNIMQKQREKMRDFQRTSRKRKREQHEGLQHRVEMLEATIADMTSTFVDMSDLVIGSGILQSQPERASVLQEQMAKFLALAESAQLPASEAREDHERMHNESSDNSAVNNKRQRNDSPIAKDARPPLDPSCSWLVRGLPPKSSTFASTGTPGKIMASAAAGYDSFLTRLYWKVAQSCVDALSGVAPLDARFKFRYSGRHFDHEWMMSKAYRAMQYMLFGYDGVARASLSSYRSSKRSQRSPLVANERELVANLRAAVELDLLRAGSSLDQYISTVDVENYLRSQWGIMPGTDTLRLLLPPANTYDPTLQHGLELHAGGVGAGKLAPKEITLSTDRLLQGLNVACVCFGDEMRLEKNAVDQAAMAVLEQAAVA